MFHFFHIDRPNLDGFFTLTQANMGFKTRGFVVCVKKKNHMQGLDLENGHLKHPTLQTEKQNPKQTSPQHSCKCDDQISKIMRIEI